MSYARFSEGGAYVFPSRDGIECCGCTLDPEIGKFNGKVSLRRWVANGTDHRTQVVNTLVHLAQHERKGDFIPKRAWDTLHAELITGDLE